MASLADHCWGLTMLTDTFSYFLACVLTTACGKTLLVFSSVLRGQMIISSTPQNNPQPWFLSGFPGSTSGKEPSCQCRRCQRQGFDPWVGKILWTRNGKEILTQYSCLENLLDRGAWRAIIHRVAKSRTWLKRLSTRKKSWREWMWISVHDWPGHDPAASEACPNQLWTNQRAVGVPFFFLEASILWISDPIFLFPCWSQILIFYSQPGLPLHTSLNKV